MDFKAYKTNIKIAPKAKIKYVGDSSKYYLYGDVVDVGSEVKEIEVGDQIGFTLWGLKEILEENGTKHYFVKDDPAFILGVIKKNG